MVSSTVCSAIILLEWNVFLWISTWKLLWLKCCILRGLSLILKLYLICRCSLKVFLLRMELWCGWWKSGGGPIISLKSILLLFILCPVSAIWIWNSLPVLLVTTLPRLLQRRLVYLLPPFHFDFAGSEKKIVRLEFVGFENFVIHLEYSDFGRLVLWLLEFDGQE